MGDLDWTQIIVALVGMFGTLAGAVGAYFAVRNRNEADRHKHRASQAESEIGLQRIAFDFTRYMHEWSILEAEVEWVLENTNIDRWLMLVAFNGIYDPRWVSDVVQKRSQGQMPTSFRHLDVDEHYGDMLRDIQRYGHTRIVVDDMPNGMLKNIYINEGVIDSFIEHIETREDIAEGAAAITICSYATHSANGLTDEDIRHASLLSAKIKGFAALFDQATHVGDAS